MYDDAGMNLNGALPIGYRGIEYLFGDFFHHLCHQFFLYGIK